MQAHPCPMLLDNTFALLLKREYKIGTKYSVGLPLNEQSISLHLNIYQINKWYFFYELPKRSYMIPSTLSTKGYCFGSAPLVLGWYRLQANPDLIWEEWG